MIDGSETVGDTGFQYPPMIKKVKTLLGDRSAGRNLLLVYGI